MFRRTALAAITFALAITSGAGATVWSAAQAITSDSSASDVAVDTDSGGEATVAWTSATGVFTATAQPGGQFAAPHQLSRHPIPGNEDSDLLAVDGQGDTVVAWTQPPSVPSTGSPALTPAGPLYIAYRRHGQAFGADRRLAALTSSVQIGIDGSGNATIVWRNAAGPGGIDAVTRAASGHLGRVQRVGPTTATEPALAVNARDDSAIAWVAPSKTGSALQYATRRDGGGFARPVTLVPARQSGDQPAVGLDSDGRVLLAWEGLFDPPAAMGAPYDVIETASAQVGSTAHSAASRLATPGRGGLRDDGRTPQVDVDPAGDALVVWATYSRSSGGRDGVEVARGGVGHALLAPQTIHIGTLDEGVNAAIGSNGDALVSWDDLFGPDGGSIAPAAGVAFAPAAAVSSPTESSSLAVVAIGPAGGAIAVWQDLGPVAATAEVPATPLLYARAPVS